jgi:hypothetical protein
MSSASDFHYDVPVVEQEDDQACWAAAIEAMLRYSKQTSTQSEIRNAADLTEGGIPFDAARIRRIFARFGMVLQPIRNYSTKEIYDLAIDKGPLWVAIDYGSAFWGAFYGNVAAANHILVITGGGSGEEEGGETTVSSFNVLDPWRPAKERTLDADDLLAKMNSLSPKLGVTGHWIGCFDK